MDTIMFDDFYVLGIHCRTSNENGQSAQDISNLWSKFIAENTLNKISGRLDDNIYCLYTDYEGDYTQPYTVILGCKVDGQHSLVEGMRLKKVNGGTFSKFVAKGNLSEGVIYQEWLKIWGVKADRVYDTDFEVWGENAKNPNDAEVDIYVAFKE